MRKLLIISFLAFVLINSSFINFSSDESKTENFTVSEGTWMNLDVSPNGKEIVFDLLGDIYLMPISGGKAKLISGGSPYEVQPRFSPDGKQILFTSDRGGADNIWRMDKNGENRKQITKENFRLLNNPVWDPNGNYILARKHFTSTRSLGAGEMWLYHISGGSGFQLTKRKNDQQDVGEPCFSSDGRYVYFSEDVYPGGYFQYNKDPNSQIYVIKRYDRIEGKTKTILGGPGGACRPQISRDGKQLAFVRRVRGKSVLSIFNLESGEERPLFWDKMSKDQQESWAIFGVYTNFNWMPDDKEIIIWGQGKIWRVSVEDGSFKEIPFSADCSHEITEAVSFKQKVHETEFDLKVIRHASTSPDGKWLIFSAVGHLYKQKMPKGKAQRITQSKDFEFCPSFSSDGNQIVYVSWNDEKLAQINVINFNEKNPIPKKLNQEMGIFRTPRFSPDGKKIIYQKAGGETYLGFTYTQKTGIYLMNADGSNAKRISEEGYEPRFDKTGKRIFFQSGGGMNKSYKSMKLDGTDKKVLFTAKYARDFVPSPDNKWIAFTELYKAYIAPMPQTGKSFQLNHQTKAVPVSQIAKDAGINLHWSADSKNINWTLGNEFFSNEIQNRFTFLEGSPDSIPPIDSTGLKINLKIKTDEPDGMIAFTNATIITMNGKEVIENGTILIERNKIKAIGKTSEISIPKSAKTIDAKGKTIMPGFIDVHAHLGTPNYISPQKQWSYYANLAYGVTTTHDPSNNTEMVFSQSEMVKAGKMIGPRIYSTGTILYGADGDFKAKINNLEDARSALRRTMAYGAFSVKSYNQPRREQRQQVIQAAKELGCMVYPEGGSTFFHNLSMILDGHTGIEHGLPISPVYDDVVQLFSRSKTGYTPTLIVSYGGIWGENYFYEKTNVWENEKLLKFTPRYIIDSRSRRITKAPDEEYENGHILMSKSCKKLADAGVRVNLGAHGQLQGLGVHWELWMLAQGGMSNFEALECATINGANYIGMGDEIGTLEVGKLADLIVLDKNPLENIRNSESVIYTMINGRLYDCETLNEIGNYDKKRTKFWWETFNYNASFPYHKETHGFEGFKCGCLGAH